MERVTLAFEGSDLFTQTPFIAMLSYDPASGDESIPGTVLFELDGTYTISGQVLDVPEGSLLSLEDGTPDMVEDTFFITSQLGDEADPLLVTAIFLSEREIIDGGVLDPTTSLADLSEDDLAPVVSVLDGNVLQAIELSSFTVSGGDDSGGGGGGGSGDGSGDGGDGDDRGDDPDDGTGGVPATGPQTLLLSASLEGGLALDGSLDYDASMPLEDEEIGPGEAFFRVDGTLTIDGVNYTAGGTLTTGNNADLTEDDAVDDEVFISLELVGPTESGSLQLGLESTGDVTADAGLRLGISDADFDKTDDIVVIGPFVPNGILPGVIDRFEFSGDDGGDGGDGGGDDGGGDDGGLGQGLTVAEAKTVARLYEAGLDRDGNIDTPGLNFWIDGRENGLSERDLAFAFIGSNEFADSFGAPESLSDRAFVEVMYLNVLDRDGEVGGVNFWTAVLEGPDFDRADVLLAFAGSPENIAGTPLVETLAEVSAGEWDFAAV